MTSNAQEPVPIVHRPERQAGILCHVTSLPGRYGLGDLGPEAYRFVDFLARTGQRLWQVLPLGPTGFGNSPYQSPSAFAGNPLLVSVEQMRNDGWLSDDDLRGGTEFPAATADFDHVAPWRQARLLTAAANFVTRATGNVRHEFEQFQKQNAAWLDDYTLFIALKEEHELRPWTEWEPELVRREPAALAAARERLAVRIAAEAFVQYQFARQWWWLKTYANSKGVRIIGDMPIFVAADSSDVWANQDLYDLDAHGRPNVVAGVPPDYFSIYGQLWGNPLYRWDVHAERGYAWWIERFRYAFTLFDLVRVDHFRGFEAYWEIPGDAADARVGRWVDGPKVDLFKAVEKALGRVGLIAEDLGVITAGVEQLRDAIGAPGMRVLQFGFDDNSLPSPHRPHNFIRRCLAYTGTHDNDTTVGWFKNVPRPDSPHDPGLGERQRANVLAYLGKTDGSEIHWDLIRLAWASAADIAIAPLQDVFGLDADARMNMPGTVGGINWRWRFAQDLSKLPGEDRLRQFTELYDRA